MNLYLDLFLTFTRIGAVSFGGGYAMLPLFKKELCEKKKWCSEEDILDYYAVAQCTPGVIAVNTASFVGYRHKGVSGAICATIGVVTPSVIIITLIAALLRSFADDPVVSHALAGIRVAVCALVTVTIFGLLRKNVSDVLCALLALGAFALTAFTSVSPVFAVLFAALCGILSQTVFARKKGGDNGKKTEKGGK